MTAFRKPLGKLLNSDGTINLASGFSGSLDARGFRMEHTASGAPRFVPAAQTVGGGDENWDAQFNLPGSNGVNFGLWALAVSGNDLYVGGAFTTAGGISANNIARWNGSSWSALGSGVNEQVQALAIRGNELYAGGFFTTAGSVNANRIARWNGSWSSLAGAGVNGTVWAVAVNGDDLYVGGEFTTAGAVNASRIARWDGRSWSALGGGVNNTVRALAILGNELYVGGDFTQAGGMSANFIARWNIPGGSWATLGSGASNGVNSGVNALAVKGSELYVGGFFTTAGGIGASRVARWSSGSWSALGSGVADGPLVTGVFALAVLGNGLYAGGSFTTAGGGSANYIARWDTAGNAWSALGSGIGGGVYALAVSGNDLYAGGIFASAGGISASRVARWNIANSSWSALGLGVNNSVGALAVDGNNLYVGGRFTTAGGVNANRIARWNGSWASVGSGANNGVNGDVFALAVGGGSLYLGGRFTMAGTLSASRIAHWNGSNWSALGSGVNNSVAALAVSGSELYVGGFFTAIGGLGVLCIAKWDGNNWFALGSGVVRSVAPDVNALAINGGSLYVGGDFTTAGEKLSNNFGKYLLPNCAAIAVNPSNPTLPAGTAGQPYSQSFTATGGAAPHSFVTNQAALPNGLTLASNGLLSGTPTVFGTFNFTLTATDANGCTGARSYSLTINPPCGTITVNPASLPNGAAGTPYNATITATGGTAPYNFTVSAGALPPGLSLSSAGVLSGTPSSGGTFGFTIKATDNNGCMGTRAYSVTITGGPGPTGLQYYPLPSPVRLLDTRPGESACFAPDIPLGNDAVRTQPAIGACTGIPANAKAIVGNATVVNFISTGFHWITLYPSDAAQPNASNLNFSDNQIVPNQFTVGLGPDGAFKIYSHASTHFIVDITGYYAPPGAGGLYYHPLPAPVRLFESRPGETGCDAPGVPLGNDATRSVLAHRTCASTTIPAAAKAIVGNATVVNFISSGSHWITLYPFGTTEPNASNLNFTANQIVPNWFVVGLSSDGRFNIYSHASTHFIVDVAGYFSDEAADVNGQGLLYNALPAPVRLLDTRPGEVGCDAPGVPLGNDATRAQTAHRTCFGLTVPSTAKAVVGNATVIKFISSGFHWITLYPFGAAQPNASNLNFTNGQIVPNAFWVGLSSDGRFNIYSHAATHFIVDLTGYFAP